MIVQGLKFPDDATPEEIQEFLASQTVGTAESRVSRATSREPDLMTSMGLNALPVLGGLGGGILGGAGGAAFGMGVGGVPGAMGGAALGGAGGEAAKQLLSRMLGFEAPETAGQAAGQIGLTGALSGLGEGLPIAAIRGLARIAPRAKAIGGAVGRVVLGKERTEAIKELGRAVGGKAGAAAPKGRVVGDISPASVDFSDIEAAARAPVGSAASRVSADFEAGRRAGLDQAMIGMDPLASKRAAIDRAWGAVKTTPKPAAKPAVKRKPSRPKKKPEPAVGTAESRVRKGSPGSGPSRHEVQYYSQSRGGFTPIEDMPVPHLRNAMNKLHTKLAATKHPSPVTRKQFEAIRDEVTYRAQQAGELTVPGPVGRTASMRGASTPELGRRAAAMERATGRTTDVTGDMTDVLAQSLQLEELLTAAGLGPAEKALMRRQPDLLRQLLGGNP